MAAALVLLLFFVPIISTLVVLFYFWNRSQFFIRRGIPGPKPSSIFTGNLHEYQQYQNPPQKLLEWEKNYGKTFAFFEGGHKVVVTSDLDILQDKCYSAATDPEHDESANVFTSYGLRWKRLRTITNPSFSVTKLKSMEPTVQHSIRALMNLFSKSQGDPLDVYPLYQALTLDVIERVAFGKAETHLGKREENPCLKLVRAFFNQGQVVKQPYLAFLASIPEFVVLSSAINKAVQKLIDMPIGIIKRRLNETICQRRQLGVTAIPKDFIDLFLNAEADDQVTMDKLEAERSMTNIDLKRFSINKKLTLPEIVGQCIVFLLAGYDTTANSLAYLTYHLATTKQVQTKLIQEIDSFIRNEVVDDINYDVIQKLSYLDWCFKESLRLNPLASSANSRICTKDCVLDDGKLKMDKGMCIMSNVWSIHYNKKIWGEDSNRFRPERLNNRAKLFDYFYILLHFSDSTLWKPVIRCLGNRSAWDLALASA